MPTTSKITIPVGFNFDSLSGDLNKVVNSFNGLKLDSKISKQIQAATSAAERQLKALSRYQDKGITSDADLNAMNRALEGYQKNLQRIRNLASGITFKDLAFSPESTRELDNITARLVQARNELNNLKKTNLTKFVDSGNWAEQIEKVTGLTRQQITTQSQLESALTAAGMQFEQQANALRQRASSVEQNIEAETRLQNLLEQSGRQNKNGVWSWNSNQTQEQRIVLRDQLKNFGKELGLGDAILGEFDTDSLNKIKQAFSDLFASPEYQNGLTQVVESLNAELRELQDKQKVVTDIMANMRKFVSMGDTDQMQANIKQLEEAEVQAKRELEEGWKTENLQKVGAAASDAANDVEKTQTALDALKNQFDTQRSAENIISNVTNSLTQLVGIGAVMNQVGRGIRVAVDQIKELDAAMNGIAVVTNFTTAELWNQIDTYMAMAKQYGVTTTGTYQVSQLYYQMGLSTNQVMSLTTETLKMAKIAGLDYAEATDYMTVA